MQDNDSKTEEKNLRRLQDLEEQVRSQQEMLESTTKFLIAAQKKLEEKGELLERKNKEMFDSIAFAKFVQTGLFPEQEALQEVFKEAFVKLRQRDVIGGDMPFFRVVGNKTIVAAIDCAGHGVSGAMLTTMAHSLMNELVLKHSNDLVRVPEIMNAHFLGSFNNGGQNLFGLDMAMIGYNMDPELLNSSVLEGRYSLFEMGRSSRFRNPASVSVSSAK